MAKTFLQILTVLLLLALGGRLFIPMMRSSELGDRSPATIYHRLEELGDNKSMSDLYDELKLANDVQLNLDHRNPAGLRALDIAASKDQWNAAAAFVVAGAKIDDIDANGDTVMHIAVRHHALHVLKELRRFMPDLNRRDQAGLTPLGLAHQLNDDAAVAILTAPFTSS
jgi:ankyrin repeat protein